MHPALKWGAIAGVVALGTLAALAMPVFREGVSGLLRLVHGLKESGF